MDDGKEGVEIGAGEKGGSLGKDSRLTVPPRKNGKNHDKTALENRRKRFAMLWSAGRAYKESSIKTCFRKIIPGNSFVDVFYNPDSDKARLANLARCNVAACPVCGPYNRLQAGLAWSAIMSKTPNKLAMLTLTVEHNKGERFAVVYGRLNDASKRMWSGRWWQGFREMYNIRGRLTSLEVTYGKNGYHPHYHIILVSDDRWPESDVLIAWATVAKRWQRMVAKSGGYASIEHGTDLKKGDAGAIDYLTKLDGGADLSGGAWGVVEEATLTDFKKGRKDGRTILQLLSDYTFRQDHDAGRRWYEIEKGLKGKSRLRASNGLWESLGGPEHVYESEMDYLDLSDSEILLLSLGASSWRMAWDKKIIPEIYEIASSGARGALVQYLWDNGIPMV